jgi:hypothetical protein
MNRHPNIISSSERKENDTNSCSSSESGTSSTTKWPIINEKYISKKKKKSITQICAPVASNSIQLISSEEITDKKSVLQLAEPIINEAKVTPSLNQTYDIDVENSRKIEIIGRNSAINELKPRNAIIVTREFESKTETDSEVEADVENAMFVDDEDADNIKNMILYEYDKETIKSQKSGKIF